MCSQAARGPDLDKEFLRLELLTWDVLLFPVLKTPMNVLLMKVDTQWKELGGSQDRKATAAEDGGDDLPEETPENQGARSVANQAYNLYGGPSECDDPVTHAQC
jgi:hypothetical protein